MTYKRAGAITPHDSNTFDATSAVYVGGAGSVVALINGVDVTFAAVPAGTTLPIRTTRIKATGTTATSIVALR